MNRNTNNVLCPCGSGQAHTACCQGCLRGDKLAPTAEALMRSRYTAYAMGNRQYLLDSWHDSTRPKVLELEREVQWLRLKILASDESEVEFVATYRVNGKAHKLQEHSRFVFEAGRWYYLDGKV